MYERIKVQQHRSSLVINLKWNQKETNVNRDLIFDVPVGEVMWQLNKILGAKMSPRYKWICILNWSLSIINPVALRMAKIQGSFGHSKCNRVKVIWPHLSPHPSLSPPPPRPLFFHMTHRIHYLMYIIVGSFLMGNVSHIWQQM